MAQIIRQQAALFLRYWPGQSSGRSSPSPPMMLTFTITTTAGVAQTPTTATVGARGEHRGRQDQRMRDLWASSPIPLFNLLSGK